MKFSIIIPARDEEKSLQKTVAGIVEELSKSRIDHEVLVVNDGSTDHTQEILQQLCGQYPSVRFVNNTGSHGFGFAVCLGLKHYQGDAAAIVMADGSDAPQDIVKYYQKLEEGYECVFGSRFMKGSTLYDYPFHKLVLNRLANTFIKVIFRLKYNDITNAFKCYRRKVIEGIQPLFSHHFNLTVEMPLKAVIRGYTFAVVPISWYNRKHGLSKLKIKEMGSRYLFIVLYLFLEKTLSCGDYYRKDAKAPSNNA